jgi:hypothetical protein
LLKRVVCYHVLGHPWVQFGGLAPDKPLDSAVLSRMKQFSAMNKLKKMALRVSRLVLKELFHTPLYFVHLCWTLATILLRLYSCAQSIPAVWLMQDALEIHANTKGNIYWHPSKCMVEPNVFLPKNPAKPGRLC